MVIGKIHLGKKKKSAPAEPEAVAEELSENIGAEETEALAQTEEVQPKKRKLKIPPLNRETLEKLIEKIKEPRKKTKRKKRKINFSLRKAIKIALILLFCFMMISPVRNCVFSGRDYVSTTVAEDMSFADSGITADKAENLTCDMIKLDQQVCYKIEFTSGINGYKYIVNANTGEIIAQAFYQIEKEQE